MIYAASNKKDGIAIHDITPVIRGMFVNSHVSALHAKKGESAVRELEKRFGAPLRFGNFQYVPVRDEVRIIEIVLDLLEGRVDPARRSFEAGRLHFRNFTSTIFGKILLSSQPKTPSGFYRLIFGARHIASHVFKHTNFGVVSEGSSRVRVIMENNDYPIEHFQGLFYEWMKFWKLRGISVHAQETAPRRYEYVLGWGE